MVVFVGMFVIVFVAVRCVYGCVCGYACGCACDFACGCALFVVCLSLCLWLRCLLCVLCVCPPLDKGFSTFTTDSQAGESVPQRVTLFSYHTRRSCGEEWEGKLGQFPVPATQLLIKPFHFLLFVSWCFMLPPPNSFLSHFQQPRVLQLVTAVKGNNHCSNTYNFSDFSPCCSTASFPSW